MRGLLGFPQSRHFSSLFFFVFYFLDENKHRLFIIHLVNPLAHTPMPSSHPSSLSPTHPLYYLFQAPYPLSRAGAETSATDYRIYLFSLWFLVVLCLPLFFYLSPSTQFFCRRRRWCVESSYQLLSCLIASRRRVFIFRFIRFSDDSDYYLLFPRLFCAKLVQL